MVVDRSILAISRAKSLWKGIFRVVIVDKLDIKVLKKYLRYDIIPILKGINYMKKRLAKRTLFDKILPWLDERKILIIKGARQTGKTTLLKQLKAYLDDQKKSTIYFPVDQELNNPIFSNHKLFIKILTERYGLASTKKLYVFLDEFQYIKNAGMFLKNIFDAQGENLQLIVSGSSSLDITKNSEFLTGRKIDFLLSCFSFKEFLSTRDFSISAAPFSLTEKSGLSDFYTLYRNILEQALLDYTNWGGYPEVTMTANENKRLILLKEIIRTYIEKDIALFLRVENISGFNNLIQILASQIGSLVNREEIGTTLGIGKNTVKKYLEILQGTFVFSFVRPFFTNIRKELTKMPKVFVSDPGIVKVALNAQNISRYSLINGRVVENFVYNELVKNNDDANIFYYRTVGGAEIDFVLKSENGLCPIEAKFRKGAQKTPVAIKNFLKKYEKDSKLNLVLTQDYLHWEKETIFLPVVLLPFVKIK